MARWSSRRIFTLAVSRDHERRPGTDRNDQQRCRQLMALHAFGATASGYTRRSGRASLSCRGHSIRCPVGVSRGGPLSRWRQLRYTDTALTPRSRGSLGNYLRAIGAKPSRDNVLPAIHRDNSAGDPARAVADQESCQGANVFNVHQLVLGRGSGLHGQQFVEMGYPSQAARVRIGPGEIALARICSGPSSAAPRRCNPPRGHADRPRARKQSHAAGSPVGPTLLGSSRMQPPVGLGTRTSQGSINLQPSELVTGRTYGSALSFR